MAWIAAVFAAVPAVSQAEEWGLSTDVQMYALGDENPGLRATDKTSSIAGVTDLRAHAYRRGETTEFTLDPSLHIQRYGANARGFDQDTGGVSGGIQSRSERGSWAINFGALRDTTLTSELGTTGITQLNLLHESFRLSTSASRLLTERLTLLVGADASYDRYPDGAQRSLYDYRRQSARLVGTYALGERFQFGLAAASAWYDSSGPFGQSDSQNATANLRYALGTRWSVGASAGPSWVNSTAGRTTGTDYSLDISRRSELGSVALNGGRSISTTGYGLLTQSDQLSIQGALQLTENLSARASLSGVQTQQIFTVFGLTFSNVRYLRTDLAAQWQFSRNWNLLVGAGYTQQHIQYSEADQQGFTARVGLTWHRNLHGR